METKQEDQPPGRNGHKMPETVGIIYSEVKREYFPTEQQYITEKDAYKDARQVCDYLEKLKIKVKLYPGNSLLSQILKKDKPDVVVNLVGSVRGQEYLAATIPALLELLEIPYTGADMLGEALSYNKFLVKKLLEQNGIPIPNCQLFNSAKDTMNSSLRFPLICKLNEIHGGVEITNDAIVESERQLKDRLHYLISTYSQPVIVEEFIVGREISGFVMEGSHKKVYLGEKVFKDSNSKYKFASFDFQWVHQGWDVYHYEKFHDNTLKRLNEKSLRSYQNG